MTSINLNRIEDDIKREQKIIADLEKLLVAQKDERKWKKQIETEIEKSVQRTKSLQHEREQVLENAYEKACKDALQLGQAPAENKECVKLGKKLLEARKIMEKEAEKISMIEKSIDVIDATKQVAIDHINMRVDFAKALPLSTLNVFAGLNSEIKGIAAIGLDKAKDIVIEAVKENNRNISQIESEMLRRNEGRRMIKNGILHIFGKEPDTSEVKLSSMQQRILRPYYMNREFLNKCENKLVNIISDMEKGREKVDKYINTLKNRIDELRSMSRPSFKEKLAEIEKNREKMKKEISEITKQKTIDPRRDGINLQNER